MLDIYDPDTYVNGPPHEEFEKLRKTDPVFFQEIPDEPGYYAILKHSDCVSISRKPNIFSSYEEGIVLENLDENSLDNMRNMLLGMDPPRHTDWRTNISPNFRRKIIGTLEAQIRTITKNILQKTIAEKGAEEIDFVHDVCAHLPSNVMGEIMDIPESDRPQIHRWAEMQAGGQDPDINPNQKSESQDSSSTASMEMLVYGMEHAKRYRENKTSNGAKNGTAGTAVKPNNITELVLAAEVDGETMSDVDFGCFFLQLVTAGNDTTRTMLASGTWALLHHPDQLQELRDDHSLIPSAIEEILRWANPLHYFRRTTTQDVEVSGVKIKAGQKIAMIYTSANRDEEVFADPHTFDIHRSPNPHLSFGIGEHFCLGVHLARMEGRIFFEELLSTFSEIQQVAEPSRIRSNLNNSIKKFPLKLIAK